MASRNRDARTLWALFAFVAMLAFAVVALPVPEPSAAHATAPEPALPAVPVRTPAAETHSTERDGIPTTDRLLVRVLDGTGRAVAGARVLYYQESPLGFPEDERGETDAAGQFRSPPLAPGAYRVRVECGELHGSVRELHLPAPVDTVLDFVLAR